MNTDDWDLYQEINKDKIVKHDTFDINKIRYVGGFDISFNNDKACAYISIFDLKSKKIIYEDHHVCEMDIPYISGYLGFREAPKYKLLLQKVYNKNILNKNKHMPIPIHIPIPIPIPIPDILMVDGFGILHHKSFGLASQLGFETDIPTIGVAKTLLNINGLNERIIKEQFKKLPNVGDFIELIDCNSNILGLALKSSSSSSTPIYVSIGHKISLETAKNIVLQTCIYKSPEPIRNSDIKSKLYL